MNNEKVVALYLPQPPFIAFNPQQSFILARLPQEMLKILLKFNRKTTLIVASFAPLKRKLSKKLFQIVTKSKSAPFEKVLLLLNILYVLFAGLKFIHV